MNIIKLLKKSSSLKSKRHGLCLYIDWQDESQSQLQEEAQKGQELRKEAIWLDAEEYINIQAKDPSAIKWQATINGIVIASVIESAETQYSIGKSNYINSCYLKSNLKKSITSLNSRIAIKTSAELFKLNILDLLISIADIALSEVLPLDGFDTLLWLIAAVSTNYNLSKIHYDWIMGYVEDLSECKFCDVYDLKKIEIATLKLREYPLSNSLLFYSNFNPDLSVLKRACLWFQRDNVKSEFFKLLKRPIKFKCQNEMELTYLKLEEWLDTAIDDVNIDEMLEKYFKKDEVKKDEVKKDEVKEVILKKTSKKINISKCPTVKIKDKEQFVDAIWEKIREDYFKLTKEYIIRNG